MMRPVVCIIALSFFVPGITARKVDRAKNRDRKGERRRNLQDLSPAWIEVTPKAPIDPRRDGCFVMVQGKAYLVGGNGPKEAVNIYDPLKRQWETPGPSPPVPIHHMQCVVADKKIWIVSAWIGEYTSVIKDSPDIYVRLVHLNLRVLSFLCCTHKVE
jgi:hypothetical protein